MLWSFQVHSIRGCKTRRSLDYHIVRLCYSRDHEGNEREIWCRLSNVWYANDLYPMIRSDQVTIPVYSEDLIKRLKEVGLSIRIEKSFAYARQFDILLVCRMIIGFD